MMEDVLEACEDIEDGEITNSSDDGGYTPLERPRTLSFVAPTNSNTSASAERDSPLDNCHQMQEALEVDNDDSEDIISDSSSTESSDTCLKTSGSGEYKKQKRVRRTVMMRVPPTEQDVTTGSNEKRARFKKYNVWSEALQEEALTENMRGCDVRQNRMGDRNVENYDFSFRHRLNAGSSLKRRLSTNSGEDFTDDSSSTTTEMHSLPKRGRTSKVQKRETVKNRLGPRYRPDSSPTSSSENKPRYLRDLLPSEGRNLKDIAFDLADKLHEKKDELLVRILDILGPEIPYEVFKETQRIEADGGMMTLNGIRRRTPGGVFLFLLKKHERLQPEQIRAIFSEDRHIETKLQKSKKASSRDRKVEELKKRLSAKEKELSALNTRKELYLMNTEHESTDGNLSNPPPSPDGEEHSPEYKKHEINLVVTDINIDKPCTSASAMDAMPASDTNSVESPKELISYDDDYLEVHCGDMDFF